jgi:hypothetical protein
MRWTRELRLTSVAQADGEVVSFWRPTLALSLLKQFGRRRWQKSSAHRGEREISRKTTAQGKPDASAEPVCSCAFFLVHFAHETAGAARIRLSLRPLIERVRNFQQTSGEMRREIAKSCLLFES